MLSLPPLTLAPTLNPALLKRGLARRAEVLQGVEESLKALPEAQQSTAESVLQAVLDRKVNAAWWAEFPSREYAEREINILMAMEFRSRH